MIRSFGDFLNLSFLQCQAHKAWFYFICGFVSLPNSVEVCMSFLAAVSSKRFDHTTQFLRREEREVGSSARFALGGMEFHEEINPKKFDNSVFEWLNSNLNLAASSRRKDELCLKISQVETTPLTEKINLTGLKAIGIAHCNYQTTGPYVPNDNPALYNDLKANPQQDAHWASFDRNKLEENAKGANKGSFDDLIRNYVSYSQWKDLDTLINTIKASGLNSIRTSPPESLFPNEKGEFNEIAIARFKQILQTLNDNGISVMITGFHFTYPQWVEDSGGYLNEENCKTFITYMERMIQEFHPLVRAWCTINEPAVFAVQKYFFGVHAGGEFAPQKMADLMVNFLKMHNTLYKNIHDDYANNPAKYQNREPILGISHDVIDFKAYNSWNPIERMVARYLTYVLHEAYLNFYSTGKFEIRVLTPLTWISFLYNWIINPITSLVGMNKPMTSGGYATYEDVEGFEKNNHYLDYIYLQIYARPVVSIVDGILHGAPYEGPEFYHPGWGCPADHGAILPALRMLHEKLGKEIEITETGCPIPRNPTKKHILLATGHDIDKITSEEAKEQLVKVTQIWAREQQAKYTLNALHQASEAIKEGIPLKAVYIWSGLGGHPFINEQGEIEAPHHEWDHLTGFDFGIWDKAFKENNNGQSQTYKLTYAGEVLQQVALKAIQQQAESDVQEQSVV